MFIKILKLSNIIITHLEFYKSTGRTGRPINTQPQANKKE